jgi:hypothetical protein
MEQIGNWRTLFGPLHYVNQCRRGFFVWDVGHRMTGCVSKKNIGPCDPNNTQKAIKLEEVEAFNNEAQFPILRLKGQTKVEMRSGQHRMAMLEELRPEEADHFWIVTIYDDCISFISVIN